MRFQWVANTARRLPSSVSHSSIGCDETEATRRIRVNGNETDAINDDGGVMVNEANVTAVDVAGSNGVIHVIDQVILPE